jgi:VIT1/CCC1 family predicted Fe2+/Mn2+ transporter
MRVPTTRTDLNLWLAFVDEAKTERIYAAYAAAAMAEGYPEAAEAFMEAAGAEIVHAMLHLQTLGAVKSTAENLRRVVEEEAVESEQTYPRYIEEARAEGRLDAVAAFELALARERKHIRLFQDALAALNGKDPLRAAPPPLPRSASGGMGKMSGPAEVVQERERIATRSRIRELVFGAQDGVLTTVGVVSSIFGAHADKTIILLAGIASGFAGMVAMTAGSYLSSKAEHEVGRSEIAREVREIREHPAEELAELVEIYRRQGMSDQQARDAAVKVAEDPNRMLEVMAHNELGLEVESSGNPAKNAGVMALSFLIGAIVPILSYVFLEGIPALVTSISLAALALFGVGVIKANVVGTDRWRSGFETFAIGAAAGILGYFFGTVIPSKLGITLGG